MVKERTHLRHDGQEGVVEMLVPFEKLVGQGLDLGLVEVLLDQGGAHVLDDAVVGHGLQGDRNVVDMQPNGKATRLEV